MDLFDAVTYAFTTISTGGFANHARLVLVLRLGAAGVGGGRGHVPRRAVARPGVVRPERAITGFCWDRPSWSPTSDSSSARPCVIAVVESPGDGLAESVAPVGVHRHLGRLVHRSLGDRLVGVVARSPADVVDPRGPRRHVRFDGGRIPDHACPRSAQLSCGARSWCSCDPRTVRVVRVGGEVLDERLVSRILGYQVLFLGTAAAGMVGAHPHGADVVTAIVGVVSALATFGPALGRPRRGHRPGRPGPRRPAGRDVPHVRRTGRAVPGARRCGRMISWPVRRVRAALLDARAERSDAATHRGAAAMTTGDSATEISTARGVPSVWVHMVGLVAGVRGGRHDRLRRRSTPSRAATPSADLLVAGGLALVVGASAWRASRSPPTSAPATCSSRCRCRGWRHRSPVPFPSCCRASSTASTTRSSSRSRGSPAPGRPCMSDRRLRPGESRRAVLAPTHPVVRRHGHHRPGRRGPAVSRSRRPGADPGRGARPDVGPAGAPGEGDRQAAVGGLRAVLRRLDRRADGHRPRAGSTRSGVAMALVSTGGFAPEAASVGHYDSGHRAGPRGGHDHRRGVVHPPLQRTSGPARASTSATRSSGCTWLGIAGRDRRRDASC